jgi:hypothetical protein
MATDPITGLKNDYTTDDPTSSSEMNKFIKYVGEGLARVLGKTLISDGVITRETNPLAIDTATGRFLSPGAGDVVAGFIGGRMFWMDDDLEVSSAATGGNTVSLIDTGLTGATDYWKYAFVVFTSGTNNGLVRQVTAYNSTTHTLSWTSPVTAVAASDTYVVTFWYIQGLTDDDGNYVYGRVLADCKHNGGEASWGHLCCGCDACF